MTHRQGMGSRCDNNNCFVPVGKDPLPLSTRRQETESEGESDIDDETESELPTVNMRRTFPERNYRFMLDILTCPLMSHHTNKFCWFLTSRSFCIADDFKKHPRKYFTLTPTQNKYVSKWGSLFVKAVDKVVTGFASWFQMLVNVGMTEDHGTHRFACTHSPRYLHDGVGVGRQLAALQSFGPHVCAHRSRFFLGPLVQISCWTAARPDTILARRSHAGQKPNLGK